MRRDRKCVPECQLPNSFWLVLASMYWHAIHLKCWEIWSRKCNNSVVFTVEESHIHSFLSAQDHIFDLHFIVWAVSDKQTEDCLVRRREKCDLKALFWIETSKDGQHGGPCFGKNVPGVYYTQQPLPAFVVHVKTLSSDYFSPCDQVLNVL